MFMLHLTLSFEFLAVVAGTALYIWALRNVGTGTGLARILGFLVMLLSVIAVICTLVGAVKFYRDTYRMIYTTGEMHNPMMMQSNPAPAPVAPAKSQKH